MWRNSLIWHLHRLTLQLSYSCLRNTCVFRMWIETLQRNGGKIVYRNGRDKNPNSSQICLISDPWNDIKLCNFWPPVFKALIHWFTSDIQLRGRTHFSYLFIFSWADQSVRMHISNESISIKFSYFPFCMWVNFILYKEKEKRKCWTPYWTKIDEWKMVFLLQEKIILIPTWI